MFGVCSVCNQLNFTKCWDLYILPYIFFNSHEINLAKKPFLMAHGSWLTVHGEYNSEFATNMKISLAVKSPKTKIFILNEPWIKKFGSLSRKQISNFHLPSFISNSHVRHGNNKNSEIFANLFRIFSKKKRYEFLLIIIINNILTI